MQCSQRLYRFFPNERHITVDHKHMLRLRRSGDERRGQRLARTERVRLLEALRIPADRQRDLCTVCGPHHDDNAILIREARRLSGVGNNRDTCNGVQDFRPGRSHPSAPARCQHDGCPCAHLCVHRRPTPVASPLCSSKGGPLQSPCLAALPQNAPGTPLEDRFANYCDGTDEINGVSRERCPAFGKPALPAMIESTGRERWLRRFKAAVSKTVVGASSTVGSNPTLSARYCTRHAPDEPLLRPARFSQRGEVPEWPNGHDWKSCRGASLSRVRIPPSPPMCDISPYTCAPASSRIAAHPTTPYGTALMHAHLSERRQAPTPDGNRPRRRDVIHPQTPCRRPGDGAPPQCGRRRPG